jgi:hypothetical protein
VATIKAQIQQENMDAIPLEKAPKVAVYAPPNAAPWDDAVTMALNYAGIKFENGVGFREVHPGWPQALTAWLHPSSRKDFHRPVTPKFYLNLLPAAAWSWPRWSGANTGRAQTLGFP